MIRNLIQNSYLHWYTQISRKSPLPFVILNIFKSSLCLQHCVVIFYWGFFLSSSIIFHVIGHWFYFLCHAPIFRGKTHFARKFVDEGDKPRFLESELKKNYGSPVKRSVFFKHLRYWKSDEDTLRQWYNSLRRSLQRNFLL